MVCHLRSGTGWVPARYSCYALQVMACLHGIVPNLRWAWTLMAFAGRYFFWTIPGMPVHVLDQNPAAPRGDDGGEHPGSSELSVNVNVMDLAVPATEDLLLALNSSGEVAVWPVRYEHLPTDEDRLRSPLALPGRPGRLLFSAMALLSSSPTTTRAGKGVAFTCCGACR